MPWLQIAWLISLVLVTTSLPAGALSLPMASEEKRPVDEFTDELDAQVPGDTDEENDKSPTTIEIIPNTDLWDGNSTRATNTGTTVTPAVLLWEYDLGVRLPQVDSNLFALIEAPIPGQRWQDCWLTCRYAHAPPIGV